MEKQNKKKQKFATLLEVLCALLLELFAVVGLRQIQQVDRVVIDVAVVARAVVVAVAAVTADGAGDRVVGVNSHFGICCLSTKPP